MACHFHINILSEEYIIISEVNTSWNWHTKKLSGNNLIVKSTGKEWETQEKTQPNPNQTKPK